MSAFFSYTFTKVFIYLFMYHVCMKVWVTSYTQSLKFSMLVWEVNRNHLFLISGKFLDFGVLIKVRGFWSY